MRIATVIKWIVCTYLVVFLSSCMSIAKKGSLFTEPANNTTIRIPSKNYKLSIIDKRTHVDHRPLKVPLISSSRDADKVSPKIDKKYFYLLLETLKKNITPGNLSLIFGVEVIEAYQHFKADTYSEYEGAYVKLRLYVKDKLTGKTLSQSDGLSWGSQKTLTASKKSIESMFRDALKMAFQDALNSISLEQLFAAQRATPDAKLKIVERFPASDLFLTHKPPFGHVGSEPSEQSVESSAAPLESSGKISQGPIRPMPKHKPMASKTSREAKTEIVGLESPTDTGFGRYYALVIGNNNYQHLPKLQTAQNDAKAVAQILGQNYGYRVNLILDARRADILIALGNLRKTLIETDNLLIYYAGHGWLDEEGNEGYWLPVDAVKDNEVQWVSNASITTVLKAMPAKHVLIVADSCYSGKLARGLHIKRKTSNYHARMASKRVRSVIASGGLEPVSDSGGKGGHSIFATAFIEALKANEKIIDSTELFTQIRRPVIINSDQTPEYADIRKAGHEGGDFLFVRWK
jgi:Caspase domain